MDHAAITLLPLVAISALASLILWVAWRGFGRLSHAFTWSASFFALALMWLSHLLAFRIGTAWPGTFAASSVLGGVAVLLGAIGFRQRAQRPLRFGWLAAVYVAQMALTAMLAAAGLSGRILMAPAYAQDLAMLAFSAGSLQGRRRTERGADIGVRLAMAAAALWILLRLADAARLGAILPGCVAVANLVQPAAVLAVSLAAIFVIAADLADQLRRLANTDRLTGLLNRRGFEEALAAILASARRHDRALALLVTDIDRFKTINDRFGHAVGDGVLRDFAACLGGGLARRDLVARIGGEEFAVLLADVDASAALCAAEVLREQVAGLRFADHADLAITASFGLAALGAADASQADLLARADAALYQSKAMGRNRVTVAA